jgi:hypothetical protein
VKKRDESYRCSCCDVYAGTKYLESFRSLEAAMTTYPDAVYKGLK